MANAKTYDLMEYKRKRLRGETRRRLEHGLPSSYTNWDCRCWKCSTAWWVYCTIRREAA